MEGLLVLKIKGCLFTGNKEEAIATARLAFQTIGDNTSDEDKHSIARILLELGLNKDALKLWKELVKPDQISSDTRCLLECARCCDDDRFILDFCSNLRNNGIWDRNIFVLEICTLETYNADNRAIELLQDFLKKPCDKDFIPIAKVWLSCLGIKNKKPELIESDINELPKVQDVSLQTGIRVCEVLRHGMNRKQAIQYAYELVRKYWNSYEAHMILILAAGFGQGEILEYDNPQEAIIGTAVKYREEDTGNEVWHIIEDSPAPDSARNEYSPEHTLSRKLLGKRIGEKFYIREGGIQDRQGVIVQVIEKYLYRLQDSMGKWEVYFPDKDFLQSCHFHNLPDGTIDFTPLVNALKKLDDDKVLVENVYKNNPLSFYLFTKHMGLSVFDAIKYIKIHPTLDLHCCHGNQNDFILAEKAMQDSTFLVMDISAITTLYYTQEYLNLKSFPTKLIVSSGTVQELKNLKIVTIPFDQQKMYISRIGNRLVPLERTMEEFNEEKQGIESLISMIEHCCIIEDGLALTLAEPHLRNKLIEFFGRFGAESIMLANQSGRALWTDDFAMGAIASSEFHIKRVWTQFVYDALVRKKTIAYECFNKISLDLIELKYNYTYLTPAIFLEAFNRTSGDTRKSPLTQTLNWFSQDCLRPELIFNLVGTILKTIWQKDKFEIRASAITTSILKQLSSRRDGITLIKLLFNNIEYFFGLDFISSQRVKTHLRLWLEGK